MTLATRKRRAPGRAPAGFDADAGVRGNTWERACAGKDRYTSEAAALVGIGLNTRSRTLDAYRCGYCNSWHLTERLAAGAIKAPSRVHLMGFVCGRCGARHNEIAASSTPWTPATRRRALLDLEPLVIAAGWSIGTEDHCPSCAAALGLETTGGVA